MRTFLFFSFLFISSINGYAESKPAIQLDTFENIWNKFSNLNIIDSLTVNKVIVFEKKYTCDKHIAYIPQVGGIKKEDDFTEILFSWVKSSKTCIQIDEPAPPPQMMWNPPKYCFDSNLGLIGSFYNYSNSIRSWKDAEGSGEDTIIFEVTNIPAEFPGVSKEYHSKSYPDKKIYFYLVCRLKNKAIA